MAPVAAAVLDEPAAKTQARPRLRVGVLADSRLQPRWLVKALAEVAASGFADVVAIADLGAPAARGGVLWRGYCRLDQRLFGRGDDPAAPADIAEIPHARYIRGDGAAEALSKLGLDVVFSTGEATACEARYGVWRFGFGADGNDASDTAGFAEAGESASASALVAALPGEEHERVLCRAWARSFPLSLSRSRRGLLPKTSGLALQALKRLHDCGPDWIAACDRSRARRAGGYLGRVAGAGSYAAVRSLQSLLLVDQWFIGYRFGNPSLLDGAAIGGLRGFHRMLPPKDRFWADPFPLEHDGRHYIFLEELPFATGKGHISVSEVDRDGGWSKPVPVLERPYHLSYPQLTRHRGQLYMVPETGKNGTVEVYRCVSFPDRWQLERVLLDDVCAADATFHRGDDGRWWMFVSLFPKDARYVEGGDELHVYYADDFLGPWKPHPRNPVNSDVRNARPAGYLYTRNGNLYRPAQVGVPLYGAGMAINQVLRLSPTEFVEKEVERIRPQGSGLLGVHTLNSTGRFTVVDAFTRRTRWP